MSRKPTAPADTADDADLQAFREAMRDVVPHSPQRSARARQNLDARPYQREADEAEALRESLEHIPDDVLIASGDILEYRAPGVTESTYRRLRRGQFHIHDELDLHGHTVAAAKAAVRDFLAECQQLDHHCIRIIHGKGLRSGNNGPVLKRHIDGWLRRRRDVLAFSSAKREQGGAGAVVVLLKSQR
ncbi:Smr/MutS family protein [Algiphilus sp.]|uniref:Smr/MutS family protein n=1 Tax=Algiphilus sp. TaxID=1872431 RepID=UPI002A628DC7|nr:Smr/MutS family endonuclease [Pseudomonadota bacterium]